MRRELLVGFLLVAAVTAVYWPVHSYPPVSLDDPGYVFDNPSVRGGLSAEGLRYAFGGVTVGNWHPLTMLSHMLDCQLFGSEESSAGRHHLVNLALHAANTLLLFVALRRMTGRLWPSALVAALFGLHPLHVESVAWISERKDVLSTFFFMLILLAYHYYARRPSLLRYVAVFVLLALGLMSKPMLVTVPLVLLLLDYWPLQRMDLGQPAEEQDADEASGDHETSDNDDADSTIEADETGETSDAESQPPPLAAEPAPQPLGRLVLEKAPLIILAAAFAALTYVVQSASGATGMLGDLPLWTRMCNAVNAYGQYLEKSFWPSPLAIIYPYAKARMIDVLIVGAALVAISVAVSHLARLRPFLLVGWCWYVVTLLPVIGLVQVGVQSMADRYTYIPLIGIFIAFAWGAAEIKEEMAAEWPAWNKTLAAAAVVAATAILAACGWLTVRQVRTWTSSEVLYRNAIENQRSNFVAMHSLGVLYWHEALQPDGTLNESKLDQAQQQFEAILAAEDEILSAKPRRNRRVAGGFEQAHRSLGLLLAVRHQPKRALEQLELAIEESTASHDSDSPHRRQPEPLRHKAWILATYADPLSRDGDIRDGKEAVRAAEEALQNSYHQPPEYYDTLAAAQAEDDRFQDAVASEEKALQAAQHPRDDDLLPGIRQRLELFRSGRPYRAAARRPQRP